MVCESEVLINARLSTVWDVLTDSSNLTVWDSGIADIDGDLQDGAAVRLRMTGHRRTLRVRVGQDPPEVMSWRVALPFHLFRAVRTFILIPQEGRILLKVSDDFSGPLGRWFSPPTAQDLDNFLDAVLRRAELLDRTS